MSIILCTPKSLPLEKLEIAAKRAIDINPENDAERRRAARTPMGRRGGERRIAVLVGRKWPSKGVRLSVSFLDTPPADLRKRILSHMNAWGEAANVVFTETAGSGKVRIARLDSPANMAGFWSYIGTEILEIEEDQPTLNLEGFTMRTSEAEFRRVVRHEAGHTLGFEHEHMRSDLVKRIDRKKAIAFYDETNGWPPDEVERQVLTPLSKKSIMGTTESDPLSIMCYQIPGEITKDGKPIEGGVDINPRDLAFAASLYPKPSRTEAQPEERSSVVIVPSIRAKEDVDTFHLVVMEESQQDSDFATILASYGGARVTHKMRLRAGKSKEPTRFGSIIGTHERIRSYTNEATGSLPGDDDLIAFGTDLFETLIQDGVRRLYDAARSRQRRRLDFVLTSMIPWIAEKPWEFAFDAECQSFLATEDVHFVRNVLTSVPADPIVRPDGPLRILVAAAQPVGFGRLSIDQEEGVIRRGFDTLVKDGLVTIQVLPRTTPDEIHEHLLHGSYNMVHFIGHGVYDENKKEGCLVFVNDRGGEYMIGQRALRELFCKRGLSLVFLNSCESGRGGRSDFNKGAAQSLVAHGLPALVANQYSVLDASATSFAKQFYACLAQGLSIGEAAREARVAVNYSLSGEPIDWAVPVVYARDPGMVLCPSAEAPKIRISARRQAANAREASPREWHVAVWDIDYVFPSLGKTLEAMNAAQDAIGFELADVSLPLDAWDRNAADGGSYLNAERLAERLAQKTAELGVDVLACVTRHWLKDDIFEWWPDSQNPPVVIFSVAGFDQLEAEGPATDRVVANAMVSALAGFYANLDAHQRGPKTCPMYYNGERDFKYLVGRLKFDPDCRKKLAEKLGAKMPALEALLKTFPGTE